MMSRADAKSGYDEKYFMEHCKAFTPTGQLTYNPQGMRDALSILTELMAFESVLDIGCCVGAYVHGLRLLNKKAYGIDFTHCPLSHSSEYTRPWLAEADISELPFKDRLFDLVIGFDILEHMHDWERLVMAVSEICRVSREWVFLRMPMTRHGGMEGKEIHEYYASVNPLPHKVRLSLIDREKWITSAYSNPQNWEHSHEHGRDFWIELFAYYGFKEQALPERYYIFPNPLMLCSFNTLLFRRKGD